MLYNILLYFYRRTLLKSIVVSRNDSNQRLDRFLQKSFPNLPNSLMYKYIRKKRIKLNGARAEISSRLAEGDVVDLYINDEFFEKKEFDHDFMKAAKNISDAIIYEDENVILVNKKQGLLCHPDNREFIDTLIGRLKRYLFEKGEYDPENENSFVPALANRIDRNTMGLVIAAKNAETLRILNEKIKNREISKYYLCVVHGRMDSKEAILEGNLIKDEDKNRVYITKKTSDSSKYIRTKYRVLKEGSSYSLLEIELLTGRTHQIRAHLSSTGHPILGDGKYGTNELNKRSGLKKQCLCSYKLSFDFETDAGILNYLKGREFRINDVWFADDFEDLDG